MMNFPRYVDNPKILHFEKNEEENAGGIRIPRLPTQNIVSKLGGRELWGNFRRPGTAAHLQRSMCKSVYPNFTVTQVEKPTCFLRKFTPDGKQLIAFSADQKSIEVYHFYGPQAANGLFLNKRSEWTDALKNIPSSNRSGEAFDDSESDAGSAKPSNPPPQQANPTDEQQRANLDFRGFPDQINPEDRTTSSNKIRQSIFETFFKLKFSIPVAPPGEQLNRECSLFTEDSKYLIVGSATYLQEENPNSSGVGYFDTYRNNESVDPNENSPLEDYSIHLLDIQRGVKSDIKQFKMDRIFFSHHQGIYLYKNKLAVFSIQHQTIHIFYVEFGLFLELQTIGRFCHADDGLLFSQVGQFCQVRPKEELFMGSLKHRLLTYMFKNAYDEAYLNPDEPDMTKLSRFYQYFDHLSKLRVWKMQLLDEDHLLLKYSREDVVTLKCAQVNSQHCFFVFYNMTTTQVLAVYENTTDDLLDLFERLTDYFRNCFLTPGARYVSSVANCIYARETYQRFRDTLSKTRPSDPSYTTKYILANLPISSQSFSPSPWLDQALFSFDDQRVSAFERPKVSSENAIRFYGRDSRIYKFQLHTGIWKTESSSPAVKRLAAFIFHPSAPFAITVQRASNSAEFLAHFHLRVDPFSVLPV